MACTLTFVMFIFADFGVVSARLQSSAQHALLTCNKPTLTLLSYSLLPLVCFFPKTFYVLLNFLIPHFVDIC